MLVDETGHTRPLEASHGQYKLEMPPATCSDGDCFIGGPARLIVEKGSPDQRQPHVVQPTVTPTPTPVPSPIQVLAVSPRRQGAFYGLSIVGIVGSLAILWWIRARWLE